VAAWSRRRPGWVGRGMWFSRRAPAVARIAPLAGM